MECNTHDVINVVGGVTVSWMDVIIIIIMRDVIAQTIILLYKTFCSHQDHEFHTDYYYHIMREHHNGLAI